MKNKVNWIVVVYAVLMIVCASVAYSNTSTRNAQEIANFNRCTLYRVDDGATRLYVAYCDGPTLQMVVVP